MALNTVFPSSEWFSALASSMLEKEAEYRRFGPMDCSMVVKVLDPAAGDRFFEVVFELHSVASIREIRGLGEAAPEHFVIEASLSAWRDMIENIRTHRGADLEHTLNYLTFPGDPMEVTGPDQLQTDTFYRYNQSIQEFFNGASNITTVYA